LAYRGSTLANSSCSDDHSLGCSRHRHYRELPHIYAIAFFGDHLNAKLAVRGIRGQVLEVRGKLDFCAGYIALMGAQISVGDLDPDQFGSGSLLVRSGTLKELWKFAVRFSASESNWNPSLANSARFYIHRCPTQRAIAFKRPIF
jgi:hypothetical protein